MKQIIVIPARMGGSRLPGKPLIEIKGIPMIERVWNQCIKVKNQSEIYVATEDIKIEEFCDSKGIQCVNTGPAHTAIDRIKLFSDKVFPDDSVAIKSPICYKYLIVNQSTIVCLNNCQSYSFLSF